MDYTHTGSTIITRELLNFLRARFALDWNGLHGAAHWGRVKLNGLSLAKETGANVRVVDLFSGLHDSCREAAGSDPEHGSRAAEMALTLQGKYFELTDEELHLLETACHGHTSSRMHEDVTVCTCWDADRLDLWRVGIRPDPARLLTEPAQRIETIEAAVGRAEAWFQRRYGSPRS